MPADVTCERCGVTASTVPLDWSRSADGGRIEYLCASCAREHLRAIEARLDSAWW